MEKKQSNSLFGLHKKADSEFWFQLLESRLSAVLLVKRLNDLAWKAQDQEFITAVTMEKGECRHLFFSLAGELDTEWECDVKHTIKFGGRIGF